MLLKAAFYWIGENLAGWLTEYKEGERLRGEGTDTLAAPQRNK